MYKTGRTNANDGGIDFVMRLVGRFFQVTEVNSYDKYLLDIDKVMHFPISFVIKTRLGKERVLTDIEQYILIVQVVWRYWRNGTIRQSKKSSP